MNLQANLIAERERFRDGYTIGHQHDSDNDSGCNVALQQFQVSGMGQNLIWNYSRKTRLGLTKTLNGRGFLAVTPYVATT